MGDNIELGYAEITTDFTSTTQYTAAGVGADITGLSVTVTASARPLLITVWSPRVYQANATQGVIVGIEEDNVEVAIGRWDQHATTQEGVPLVVRVRRNPSAGSHTYKATLASFGGSGISTFTASAGAPAHIQVVEV